MQEYDWESFVDTLIRDDTRDAHGAECSVTVVRRVRDASRILLPTAHRLTTYGTFDTERSACIQPAASLVPPTTPVTCFPTYAARYPCSPAHATCSPAACHTASAAVATIQ